jgi:FixJ family two-component response regulator
MRGGASEVLLKPVNEEQILRAVRVALKQAHEQWVDRQLTLRIRKNYNHLTPRVCEVLPYIVRLLAAVPLQIPNNSKSHSLLQRSSNKGVGS